MNLRDLNYLIAVADCKNFSQAANHCAICQSTLSTQIKKLEDYLNVPIFVREKNQVSITELGEQIVQVARTVMNNVEHIRQIAAQAQNPQGTKLSLGAFPSVASYVLPEYVFRIKQHFPDMKMLLIEEKTSALMDLLLGMKLDAALLALPVEHPELESRILFEDPFTLAVCPDHPLAGLQEVDLNSVDRENLLLLDEGHCLRDQALKLCNPSRFIEDDFRASSLETLRFMVKNGVGITLMPSVAVQPDDSDIRYIDIKQQPSRTIAMVWRKNHPRKKLFEQLAVLLAYKPLA
ncbi:LysR family transcriptional regulator [Methylobacillus arboreus]|uniref:LysR substrate-binding domain-containing protein n=1 Tax=Methylobacillus arboreus TaxID=755170 RepID=UPI001E29F057|nr:LysR substrate-binding domain-containing protein [Methylobacillus arboreus]MCB5190804.1 LysR family transcriptional regulator [Methylobacillus arboreus]